MARNPSATQPRDAEGRYATTGRPSKRDRSWRTEAGYEDTSEAEDTEPDTPSDAKAARKPKVDPYERTVPVWRGSKKVGTRTVTVTPAQRALLDDAKAKSEARVQEAMAAHRANRRAGAATAAPTSEADRPSESTPRRQGRVAAAATAAGGKVRDGHNRRMSTAAGDQAARKANKAKGIKPKRVEGAGSRFAQRAVKGLARKLAKTVDEDRPLG